MNSCSYDINYAFAGGHAAFKGASNIQGGLTIDLHQLDSIEVSSNRKTTSVGSGARWEDVYAKLDPMKLAVIGGRNGDIGVGGLTLGGDSIKAARLQGCSMLTD